MHDTPKAASFSPALPVGIKLGKYTIRKVIGNGGFGITYLAQEDITDKLVVIKENYPAEVSFRDMNSLTVGPAGESRKEAYEWAHKRFLDEAKLLSRLSHPNIVPILTAFTAHGTAYYVMPHVEGTELHKAAPAPGSLTAEWLLPVLEKILSALGYLHAQGLIHRDIKPTNILMSEDSEPILIDFGTARTLESTQSHTHIGTPGFMPLEQLSPKGKRGPWTDFYALGATCYYLITGELPPHSVDRMEEDEYLPLVGRASLAERFPEHVLSSIDKALSMNKTERWQSAREWLQALNAQPKTIRPTLTREQAQEELARQGINSRKYGNTLLSAAEKGEAHMIALLIAAGANVNKTDKWGESPLHHVASYGHPECMSLLLATPGINVNKETLCGNTPLGHAAANGQTECVRLLLEAPEIGVNTQNEDGDTALSAAASNGYPECVKLLLASPGINVNTQDKNGNTPLYGATANGQTECVRLLLAAPGIDVNKANNNGETPLNRAALGHTECVRLLLDAPGIDVNKANQYGETPLNKAAYIGLTECVRLLLDAPGIDVNKANNNGETPLCKAAKEGHTECVRLLLAAPGIDVNQANQNGETPLNEAASRGHTDCVRLLLAVPGINVNKANYYKITPLHEAVLNNHTECAELIRAAGGKLNDAEVKLQKMGISPGQYNSSLYRAANNGEAETISLLLKAGANVNWENMSDQRITPLCAAAQNGHTECVRTLLAAPGININTVNTSGSTPLLCAAQNGHTECVRTLLAAPGININTANISGSTPLLCAAQNGHTGCVRALLAAPRIDIDKEDKNGYEPLYWAVKNNHTECAELIRAAGGKLNNAEVKLQRMGISPGQYNSSLYAAAKNGEAETIYLLLKAGANVNWENMSDLRKTPLCVAAKNGHTECVRALLTAPRINVNKADYYKITPLLCAAQNGHTECVKLLLTAPKIDVNKETPLYWAAFYGHTECVRTLLAAPGIYIKKSTSLGKTALDIAEEKKHTECVRLIRAAIIKSSKKKSKAFIIFMLLLTALGCCGIYNILPPDTKLQLIGISSEEYNGALMKAANSGNEIILRLLLAAGADVNCTGFCNNNTPLHEAAGKGYTECVRLLLKADGIDVNKVNSRSQTPLSCAASGGRVECVRLLLAAPGIDAKKGSPAISAERNYELECAELIRAAGGK